MPHKITFRVDDDLYNEVVGHGMATSDLIRESVRQFLNPKIENVGQDEDDTWNEAYNQFYNAELVPLRTETKMLKIMVEDLRKDKQYFKSQINALMLAKLPLLSRIKEKLLNLQNVQ